MGKIENDKMLAPPNELTTPGRANPRGISYLYAASNDETSIAEIRPWKGAIVTVANLQISKKLSVVDLSSISLSPFRFDSPISALIVEKMLNAFAHDLSQPVNPNNLELDYLPTQFITELIKSKKYDGILFKSSLGSGKNIVIFDEMNVCVIDTSYKTITDICYTEAAD